MSGNVEQMTTEQFLEAWIVQVARAAADRGDNRWASSPWYNADLIEFAEAHYAHKSSQNSVAAPNLCANCEQPDTAHWCHDPDFDMSQFRPMKGAAISQPAASQQGTPRLLTQMLSSVTQVKRGLCSSRVIEM